MAKKKTTVYLDEDLLRAARVFAARNDIRDSEVFEVALRKFFGGDLLERVRSRSDLSSEDALALAYSELQAYRASAGEDATSRPPTNQTG